MRDEDRVFVAFGAFLILGFTVWRVRSEGWESTAVMWLSIVLGVGVVIGLRLLAEVLV